MVSVELSDARSDEQVRFRALDNSASRIRVGRDPAHVRGVGLVDHIGASPVLQISVRSDSASASSMSTPKYRTVLSIFVWPSRICTARKFPVCL